MNDSNTIVEPSHQEAPPISAGTGSRWSVALRALHHRNFQLFFGGQLISLVGTWMQSVAQAWLVYRITDSSLLLGSVGFASQIPVFLVAPLGGADHAPTRSSVACEARASWRARSRAAFADGEPSVAAMMVGMTASLVRGS